MFKKVYTSFEKTKDLKLRIVSINILFHYYVMSNQKNYLKAFMFVNCDTVWLTEWFANNAKSPSNEGFLLEY